MYRVQAYVLRVCACVRVCVPVYVRLRVTYVCVWHLHLSVFTCRLRVMHVSVRVYEGVACAYVHASVRVYVYVACACVSVSVRVYEYVACACVHVSVRIYVYLACACL